MFPISLKSLSDKERHDYILKTFMLNKSQTAESRKQKRDIDIIREHHRFLWDDEAGTADEDSWEMRLVKKYYDKLFKEYCIADLTRHKENKIALRWRTEAEVVAGTGQFVCGSRKCQEKDMLRSWEVNFAYLEQGERKNALVKVRLCPEHSSQLNYTSKKREIKRLKHSEKRAAKEAKRNLRKLKKKKAKENVDDIAESTEQTADDYCDKNEINEKPKEDNELSNTDEEQNDSSDEMEQQNADDVWNKKPELDSEPISRETEFERYLEDLLL